MRDKIPPRPDHTGGAPFELFTQMRLDHEHAVAKVAVEALLGSVKNDGGTDYGSEDQHPVRACCRELSWESHAADCWVVKCREALRQIEESGWTP